MVEMIQVYRDYDTANNALSSYVKRNTETVERMILEEMRSSDRKIEITHLIELSSLEENGATCYFFNDGILSIGTEGNGSDTEPYNSVDELASKTKERIDYQKQRCETETRCNVIINPVFYTVEAEEKLDEGETREIIDYFAKNVPASEKTKLEDALRENPLNSSLERGLSKVERRLFEKLMSGI